MKVINENDKTVYIHTCTCNTKVEYTKDDLNWYATSASGQRYGLKCPTCHLIYFGSSLFLKKKKVKKPSLYKRLFKKEKAKVYELKLVREENE